MSSDADQIVKALVELSHAPSASKTLLQDVSRLLRAHVRESDEALTVTLITPSGKEAALVASVTALLTKKYNRPVQVQEKSDPSLIGGAVVQIGDQQIDLSVRNALSDIETGIRNSSSLA